MKLPTPRELTHLYPLPPSSTAFIQKKREEVRAILKGKDQRLLAIIGPCSLHSPEELLLYAERFSTLQKELQENVLLLLRVHFEKPRTLHGWSGFLYDPLLDGSYQLALGLQEVHRLLVTLASLEIPVASELLDPYTPAYFSKLLTWGAIGARTCTSQPHRQIASAQPFPVGFKNPLDGNLTAALYGILAAGSPHHFFQIDQEGGLAACASKGNPDCHLVLRGAEGAPNYNPSFVQTALRKCQEKGVFNGLVIDCAHDNSYKQHTFQIPAFESFLEQFQKGASGLCGFMLESYLEAGCQPLTHPLKQGLSVTDPCLDWETTETLLLRLVEGAAAVL